VALAEFEPQAEVAFVHDRAPPVEAAVAVAVNNGTLIGK
jgi:hypothetical protein